jgi:hypothetical protein
MNLENIRELERKVSELKELSIKLESAARVVAFAPAYDLGTPSYEISIPSAAYADMRKALCQHFEKQMDALLSEIAKFNVDSEKRELRALMAKFDEPMKVRA